MNKCFLSKVIVSVLLALTIIAVASLGVCDEGTWDCAQCGRTGNTGNYCGSCAHPAPWIVFGVNLTSEACNKEIQSLCELASVWTQDTVPQMLTSFPFLPDSILQLLTNVTEVPVSLDIQGSNYYLYTSAGDLFSDMNPDSTDFSDDYVEDNRIETIPITQADEHVFTFSSPGTNGIHAIDLSYYKAYGEINERLSIDIRFETGKVVPTVSVSISNSDFEVCWAKGGKIFIIFLTNQSDKSLCNMQLLYDLQTGNIRSFVDYNNRE